MALRKHAKLLQKRLTFITLRSKAYVVRKWNLKRTLPVKQPISVTNLHAMCKGKFYLWFLICYRYSAEGDLKKAFQSQKAENAKM